MYGVPKVLSPVEILKKVSEWDLWRYYIPGAKLKTAFRSPLRKDETPSASLFVSYNGDILLKDYRLGSFNIWQFIQQKYNVTFIEALKIVDNDFNLGLNSKLEITKPTMEYFGIVTGEKVTPSEHVTLPIKKRAWNKYDEIYWNSFLLSTEFIKNYDIVPLEHYWVDDKLVYWYNRYDPAYSIEFGNGIRKIYRPFAQKYKWLTNAGNDIIQGNKFLDTVGDILIITKSYKDVLVLKSYEYQAVAPQSETVFIPDNIFKNYRTRFNKIYILWDNDETGEKYSKKFTELYDLYPIFVPKESGEKDISDYCKTYGNKETVLLLKQLIWNN